MACDSPEGQVGRDSAQMFGYRHHGSKIAVAQERRQPGHVEISNVYPSPRGNAVESVLRLAFKTPRETRVTTTRKECQERGYKNGKTNLDSRFVLYRQSTIYFLFSRVPVDRR